MWGAPGTCVAAQLQSWGAGRLYAGAAQLLPHEYGGVDGCAQEAGLGGVVRDAAHHALVALERLHHLPGDEVPEEEVAVLGSADDGFVGVGEACFHLVLLVHVAHILGKKLGVLLVEEADRAVEGGAQDAVGVVRQRQPRHGTSNGVRRQSARADVVAPDAAVDAPSDDLVLDDSKGGHAVLEVVEHLHRILRVRSTVPTPERLVVARGEKK
mmetsp:Transcript_4113/g.7208  ORF Transcript_4113/g.7208 Transcript_4113/m.7208 type:complete len:212 (-) Transcript_4113:343-978(-)